MKHILTYYLRTHTGKKGFYLFPISLVILGCGVSLFVQSLGGPFSLASFQSFYSFFFFTYCIFYIPRVVSFEAEYGITQHVFSQNISRITIVNSKVISLGCVGLLQSLIVTIGAWMVQVLTIGGAMDSRIYVKLFVVYTVCFVMLTIISMVLTALGLKRSMQMLCNMILFFILPSLLQLISLIPSMGWFASIYELTFTYFLNQAPITLALDWMSSGVLFAEGLALYGLTIYLTWKKLY